MDAQELMPNDAIMSPKGIAYRVLHVAGSRVTLIRIGDESYSSFETAMDNISRYGYRKMKYHHENPGGTEGVRAAGDQAISPETRNIPDDTSDKSSYTLPQPPGHLMQLVLPYAMDF